MWKLCIEDDQASQTVVNLVRDTYSIGRDKANTVRLTERNISRKHAVLRRNGAAWVLEDLASYNGCFVNGARVSGQQEVGASDLIQLGDYRIELVDESAVGAGDAASASAASSASTATFRELPERLVMLAAPSPGAAFPLGRERLVIGRGEECDIAINDTSVSRVHAELQPLADGRYEVIDRDSSNGVRVNGVELKRGLVDAGDIIELGDVQLKFVPAGQIYHPDQDQGAPAMARLSFDPTSGTFRETKRGRAGLVAVLAVAGLLAGGGVLLLGNTSGEPTGKETAARPEPEVSPAARALEEAKQLLESGKLEEALEKTQEIPEDSNLRQSAEFKEIQARWAGALFEQAQDEPDEARRRALLDLIAKSPDVGSVHRKRAVNELEQMNTESVGIADLPSEISKEEPDAEDGRARAAAFLPPPRPTPRPAAAPSPARKPSSPPPQPAPAPAEPPAEVKNGLVRDTPF